MKHKSIHALALTGLTFVSALCDGGIAASADGVETIILIRHGEKPHDGLGQLNCQGLNRALALPAVIAKKYGGPGAVFAPDPAQQKEDDGVHLVAGEFSFSGEAIPLQGLQHQNC